MVIKLDKVETKYDSILVSYNNGGEYDEKVLSEIENSKIGIPRTKCDSLGDILLANYDKSVKVYPVIEDASMNFYYNLETNGTVYTSLNNLGRTLEAYSRNEMVGKSPEFPLSIHVTELNGNLDELNRIILENEVYVDISSTNLKHETNKENLKELIDMMCYEGVYDSYVDPSVFPDLENVEAYDGGELTPELTQWLENNIKMFPLTFAGNTYITGITIPKDDTYSESSENGGIFTGCSNLNKIIFENDKFGKYSGGFGNCYAIDESNTSNNDEYFSDYDSKTLPEFLSMIINSESAYVICLKRGLC